MDRLLKIVMSKYSAMTGTSAAGRTMTVATDEPISKVASGDPPPPDFLRHRPMMPQRMPQQSRLRRTVQTGKLVFGNLFGPMPARYP